jgi:hypothetical protein
MTKPEIEDGIVHLPGTETPEGAESHGVLITAEEIVSFGNRTLAMMNEILDEPGMSNEKILSLLAYTLGEMHAQTGVVLPLEQPCELVLPSLAFAYRKRLQSDGPTVQ